MTWILPDIELPIGGRIRTAGQFNRRAYDRAYYHAKRKGIRPKQTYTPEQAARRRAQSRACYYRHLERSRALARARYWRRKAKA